MGCCLYVRCGPAATAASARSGPATAPPATPPRPGRLGHDEQVTINEHRFDHLIMHFFHKHTIVLVCAILCALLCVCYSVCASFHHTNYRLCVRVRFRVLKALTNLHCPTQSSIRDQLHCIWEGHTPVITVGPTHASDGCCSAGASMVSCCICSSLGSCHAPPCNPGGASSLARCYARMLGFINVLAGRCAAEGSLIHLHMSAGKRNVSKNGTWRQPQLRPLMPAPEVSGRTHRCQRPQADQELEDMPRQHPRLSTAMQGFPRLQP